MKSIELTEEHKSKLLEMCKALFPEYKRVEITDYQIDIDRNHSNPVFIDLYKGELTVPFDIYSIHWFEFCINHLSKKVYTIDGKVMSGYTYFINNIRYTKKHPVDYLYEEFKKLK